MILVDFPQYMIPDAKWFFSCSSVLPIYLMKTWMLYCDIHVLIFNAANMKNISKVVLVLKPEPEPDLLNTGTNDSTGVLRAECLLHKTFSPKLKTWLNESRTSLRIYYIGQAAEERTRFFPQGSLKVAKCLQTPHLHLAGYFFTKVKFQCADTHLSFSYEKYILWYFFNIFFFEKFLICTAFTSVITVMLVAIVLTVAQFCR